MSFQIKKRRRRSAYRKRQAETGGTFAVLLVIVTRMGLGRARKKCNSNVDFIKLRRLSIEDIGGCHTYVGRNWCRSLMIRVLLTDDGCMTLFCSQQLAFGIGYQRVGRDQGSFVTIQPSNNNKQLIHHALL